METNQNSLEGYLKTENEHWNNFAYTVHCEAVKQGLFTDPTLPLHLIEKCIQVLEEHHQSPITGVELILAQLTECNLNAQQQLFIYEYIHVYLQISAFDNDLSAANKLLKSHEQRLRSNTLPAYPMVKNIREMLKELMQKELEALPKTLQGMEPEKRLAVLCKLIPYVLPKIESIEATNGEPVGSSSGW